LSKLYVDELHPKTSGNHVRMPDKPAFQVSTDATYTHTGGNVVQFDNDSRSGGLNRGNVWNTSTYKFTAPCDGLYQFYVRVSINSGEETRSAQIKCRINGTELNADYVGRQNLDGTTTGGTSYLKTDGQWILDLSDGDEIDFVLVWETDGGSDGFDSTESVHIHGTYANGFLIG